MLTRVVPWLYLLNIRTMRRLSVSLLCHPLSLAALRTSRGTGPLRRPPCRHPFVMRPLRSRDPRRHRLEMLLPHAVAGKDRYWVGLATLNSVIGAATIASKCSWPLPLLARICTG